MENKTNRAYTYHFATGDETVEIPGYWADILDGLDREEYNNDRKQFRDGRRCVLEFGNMEDKMIGDPFDLEEAVLAGVRLENLTDRLTGRQTDVLMALLHSDGNMREAADRLGMNRSTFQCHTKLLRDKLYHAFHEERIIDDAGTGRNIRKAREDAGLSGGKMADKIGINYRKYYRIEKGEIGINSKMANRIAECLGIVADEIIAYKNGL